MSMHSIEAGQRLEMKVSGSSSIVHVIAEAVVPAGYWICRDEVGGRQRVIAATALFPLPAEPAAVSTAAIPAAAPAVSPGPLALNLQSQASEVVNAA